MPPTPSAPWAPADQLQQSEEDECSPPKNPVASKSTLAALVTDHFDWAGDVEKKVHLQDLKAGRKARQRDHKQRDERLWREA